MTSGSDNVFADYLRLRGGVKCLAGGRELDESALLAGLKSPDPMLRGRAWDALQGAWAGLEGELVPLLERSCHARKSRSVEETFGASSAPLLAGVESVKAELLRALDFKAGRIGAAEGRFGYRDLWARVPSESDPGMPLAAGLKLLWKIFDKTVEGGAEFAMQFFPGDRLRLEGESPRCHQEPGGQALVCLPENYGSVHLSDLPVIAHELGHALHCDAAERAGVNPAPQFAETLSQFFEEAAWRELCSGGAGAAELGLDRLSQLAADLLLVPALLEFEERACAAAAAGPLGTPAVLALEKELFAKWFGLPPAGFWLRSRRLFDPALPFDGFVYLSGRLLSLGLAGGGRLSRAGLEELVKDTAGTDLNGFLAKRHGGKSPGDAWAGMLSPVRELLAGMK